jgi:hypothetical protein
LYFNFWNFPGVASYFGILLFWNFPGGPTTFF